MELVHTLNRLGHGVSYSQVQEIEAALYLQKLLLSEGSVALPRNIHPGVFTTLAWDNIDRLKETVSGEGTSHRVNGIQAKVGNPQPPRPMSILEKTKKRSISTDPLLLPTYNTAFVELMENNWINPLSHDHTDLVSLSTGIVAPPDVANGLLKAHTMGEAAYQAFKTERLKTEQPTVKFHGTLKKRNLKTFQHIKRKTGGKVEGKQVVLKADRNLFGHMILIAQNRKLHIRDVLVHPLGPLPWALSNSDGSLRKTNKAALARELEKNVSPAEDMPEPSACIIDGMSLVQKPSSA
ncbi:hypothetical protein CgunFtcFv8_024984 [Champsocephalus gunnari]|uniref:Uncharacterized protein n=1 Tax=Champsocephalus gunnari TaxID=52237 RepID=A0AAN8DDX6_CHAGU|nr:hypothetical protein CgunFtcFv8_024984 [Champsocephalus gunnari]